MPATIAKPRPEHLNNLAQDIINILEIPHHLLSRNNVSFCQAYQKYVAIHETQSRIDQMWKDGVWKLEKPGVQQVIEIFVSKTSYFSNYHKTFPLISNYPQMQQWLEGGEDAPSDMDTWGFVKTVTFQDLKEFLKRKAEESSRKGKRKAKVISDTSSPPQASTRKGKKKQRETESDKEDIVMDIAKTRKSSAGKKRSEK